MKSFDKLVSVTVLLTAVLFLAVNIASRISGGDDGQRNVEISRIVRTISDTGEIPDVSGYKTICGIYAQSGGGDFFVSDNSYVIREVNGKPYRIEYTRKNDTYDMLYINTAIAVFFY